MARDRLPLLARMDIANRDAIVLKNKLTPHEGYKYHGDISKRIISKYIT